MTGAAVRTEVVAIAGRRLHHLLRAPGRVLGIALNPLVSMLMLGYLFRDSISPPAGGGYGEYLFAGAAVQVGLSCVGPTAVSLSLDLRAGLIDRFRSLPITRPAFLLGHTLADFLVGLLGLAVATAVGLAIGWRPHTGPLSVAAGFAVIAAFVYVMLWLGVLFALTMRSVETISVVTPFLVVVLPFLSSAFLAPEKMPALIRPVAEWNPVSAVIGACRALWGNPTGASSGFVAGSPGVVAAVTLAAVLTVCVLVSLRRYRTAG